MFIGVDIEDINRFKNYMNNKALLSKIFTKKELEYCLSKKISHRHLAARYAAKEAVIKAFLSSNEKLSIKNINQIEILNDKNGAPRINIKNHKKFNKVKISMSHNKDSAIAFALLSKS